MTDYYAHSDPRPNAGLPLHDGATWQRLREHLIRVAHRARHLARMARPDDLDFATAAKWAGLLHDLGKYRPQFQERLLKLAQGEKAEDAPHAYYGAAWAYTSADALDVVLADLGHHAGLHAYRDLTGKITGLSPDELKLILANAGSASELGGLISGAPRPNNPARRSKNVDRAWELRQRMLFSVLVDADRLDCQSFEQRVLGECYPLEGPRLKAPRMFKELMHFIDRKAQSVPEGVVKHCRGEILQACLEAAGRPERLFSLCVPTGGGKIIQCEGF